MDMTPSVPRSHSFIGRLAAGFYAFAAPHRLGIGLGFLLIWGLLCSAISSLRLNNAVTAFFPDHTAAAHALARNVETSAAARAINIDLYSPDGDTGALARAAESLTEQLSAVAKTAEQTSDVFAALDPNLLFALLPSLFDKTTYKAIEDSITPEVLEAAADRTFAALTGMPFGGMTDWLRQDPLEWRRIVLQRLPQPQGFPAADVRYGYPVTPDGKHLLLSLMPSNSSSDAHAAVAIMNACDKALANLPSSIRSTLVSGLRHTAANTRAIDADITRIALLSLLGIVLIYALLVRSWGAFWIFVTPLAAVSASLGIMSFSLASVSGLALGFGAAVLGIAEDYAVHCHFALRTLPDKGTALATLAPPLAQGLLLNASGFVVLLCSSLPALRQLALFALLALCAGFVLAVFLLPLLPGFAYPPLVLPPKTCQYHAQMPRPLPVCVMVTVLVLACCVMLHLLPVDVSPRSMGAQSQAILRDTQELARIWQPNRNMVVLVEDNSPEATLGANARLLEELRSRLPQAKIWGSADLLPPAHIAQENCRRWQQFTKHHAENIRRALEQAARSRGLPEQFFAPFAESLLTTPSLVTLESYQKICTSLGQKELCDALLQTFPETDAQHGTIYQSFVISEAPLDTLPAKALRGGILLTLQTLQQTFQDAFAHERRYLPWTLVLCALLLYGSFGNMRQTLLAIVSPLASLATILAGLLLWGNPLNMAHIAALPLVFGLAVDHGIMVTHDLANGVPLGIEKAVVVSSLTACMGMGLLAFASHPALQAMGQVIFLGLAMEVPTSLWLLPLFCSEQS